MSCIPRCEGGISTDVYVRKILRRRWRSAFIGGGSRTASILRYTQGSAGNPSRGIPPGFTLDPNLADLEVVISTIGRYDGTARDRQFVRFREGQLEFGFMDIPTSGGVPAYTIQLTDLVQQDSKLWRPSEVRNDIGQLSYATCDLYER